MQFDNGNGYENPTLRNEYQDLGNDVSDMQPDKTADSERSHYDIMGDIPEQKNNASSDYSSLESPNENMSSTTDAHDVDHEMERAEPITIHNPVVMEGEYRGFSTSITGLSDTQSDACALACCGVLQSDRDRFFVTGIEPPSLARRFFIHVATPIILFALACYGAVHIPDKYFNELVSTLLVSFILLLLLMQVCCKNRWKRVEVRRELLFRKYQHSIGNHNVAATELPDYDEDEAAYLQGQSSCDLNCAHSVVGCYRSDLKGPRPPSNDVCECLAKVITYGCCFGSHLQINGMCAVAQEARELNILIPAEQRRIDYITMQHSLDYHGLTHSRLTRDLFMWWAASVILLIGLGVWLDFSLGHVWIFVATFGHALFLLWLVHGLWHSKDLTSDLTIKAFSCGFFLSITMAITWELFASLCLRIILDLIFALFGMGIVVNENGYEWIGIGKLTAISSHRDYMYQFGQNHPFLYSLLLLFNAFVIAAFLEELAKYLGFVMISDHPDFWTKTEMESAVYSHLTSAESSTEESTGKKSKRQRSSRKRLAPHIQELLGKEPRSNASRGAVITVAMVSVALGFACCENIMYIFVYNENTLQVEISVLVARILFPLHPICAAIQSIGVVRRDIENDSFCRLGKGILWPAILLHGSFDWILFVGDLLGLQILALILAMMIFWAGCGYYFLEAKKQRSRLQGRDRQYHVDQSSFI